MRVLRYAVGACVIGLPISCALAPAGSPTEGDITLPKRDVDEADAGTATRPVAPAPIDAGADAALDAGRTGPLRAFVSSTLVKGNAIGGLPGADAICNNAAS